MNYKIADRIRILSDTEISYGYLLTVGSTYAIRRVSEYGVYIVDDRGESFLMPKSQLHYTELIEEVNGMNEEDYEMGAELGEPSAEPTSVCNCLSIAEIYSEVVDMKTMIARLLKNGGDEE